MPDAITDEQIEWTRRIESWLDDSVIPAYMHRGIINYVIYGHMPGGFLTAVFEGRWLFAFNSADSANEHAFIEYFRLMPHLPTGCYGSPGTVLAWAKKGGLAR